MTRIYFLTQLLFILFISATCFAQVNTDTLPSGVTLQQCVQYALKHYPQVQQAVIDEKITDETIKSKLADWYPQINFAYNLQHNFQVQTSIIGGNPVALGVDNTSLGQLSLTQNIFNRDVFLALKSKGDVQLQAKQNTINRKIDLTATVSKAFYDILATDQQIKVADQNIVRLERSLKDAYNQFKAGVVDKTDYKRTTITLNNVKASRKANQELEKAKKEYLKYLMAYPDSATIDIAYDSAQIEKEIIFDTLQVPEYTSRIEYRQLETQRKLQLANLRYEKNSYLPSLALNGAYNLNYLNDNFSKLYNTSYPNSFAAITLAVPIYQGGKRKAKINVADWQVKRVDKDIENLKGLVNTQYANALASYKSNYANYIALKENMDLAQEVYNVIELQYKSGIKTYLEVITSETDLRTSQINYFNALYQLLASKIDAQKALGQITGQ